MGFISISFFCRLLKLAVLLHTTYLAVAARDVVNLRTSGVLVLGAAILAAICNFLTFNF